MDDGRWVRLRQREGEGESAFVCACTCNTSRRLWHQNPIMFFFFMRWYKKKSVVVIHTVSYTDRQISSLNMLLCHNPHPYIIIICFQKKTVIINVVSKSNEDRRIQPLNELIVFLDGGLCADGAEPFCKRRTVRDKWILCLTDDGLTQRTVNARRTDWLYMCVCVWMNEWV